VTSRGRTLSEVRRRAHEDVGGNGREVRNEGNKEEKRMEEKSNILLLLPLLSLLLMLLPLLLLTLTPLLLLLTLLLLLLLLLLLVTSRTGLVRIQHSDHVGCDSGGWGRSPAQSASVPVLHGV
jgi:hypothetical protein